MPSLIGNVDGSHIFFSKTYLNRMTAGNGLLNYADKRIFQKFIPFLGGMSGTLV
ncbi:hypothetical protein BTN50_1493 [Candidatus Enterovibrio altilux]|uniref:Uncharacterized protein n=1 Tax=Candidatus Enterovibrio altilux TaxID=1927128 RepID=A0A291BAF5_9GAMM|nr:hypothetical protein BTN50_1493 [Candidatus Enterovibrio luxaltus]